MPMLKINYCYFKGLVYDLQELKICCYLNTDPVHRDGQSFLLRISNP